MALDQTKAVATRNTALYVKAYASGNAAPTPASWGTAPSGYTDLGGTTNRMEFQSNIRTTPLYADQAFAPILQPYDTEDLRLGADLIEITAANLKFALGQGAITTVAAGSGTRGTDTLLISGNPTQAFYTTLMMLQGQDLEAFEILLWNSFAVGSPRFNPRPTALGVLALEMSAVPDSANSNRVASIVDVIAALP